MASNTVQGLAYRDTFAASLAAIGMSQHLDRLQLTDLLVDRSRRCWLVADSPVRYRRSSRVRWIPGAILIEVTRELRALILQSHRLLARGEEVPALFLTAQGKPARQSVLTAAIRKRRASGQIPLQIEKRSLQLLPTSRHRLFTRLIYWERFTKRIPYRAMAKATGVDSRYWWRFCERKVKSVPTPGVLARLAILLNKRVVVMLSMGGYDPGGCVKASRIYR